jgi:hypothetical protein
MRQFFVTLAIHRAMTRHRFHEQQPVAFRLVQHDIRHFPVRID